MEETKLTINETKEIINKKKNIKRSKIIRKTEENYQKIYELSKNVKNKKYQYLPYWKEKESDFLLKELKNPRKYFKEFKRGTIVRVNFGVNIGCEFSQIHYAIVLNKKDNRMSETISVIPITSKNKESNLNIGHVVYDNAMSVLDAQFSNLFATNYIEEKEFIRCAKGIMDIFDFYTLFPISSFACYRNIITISKSRILNPLNEFDFINKTKCNVSVMKKIDKAILKYYTDIII